MTNLIELLRTGASISRDRNINLDYAKVADEAADKLEALHQVCRNVYEVWAGSEGIPEPKTFREEYLIRLLEQTRDEAKKGLK
jgi:hypothetical protein